MNVVLPIYPTYDALKDRYWQSILATNPDASIQLSLRQALDTSNVVKPYYANTNAESAAIQAAFDAGFSGSAAYYLALAQRMRLAGGLIADIPFPYGDDIKLYEYLGKITGFQAELLYEPVYPNAGAISRSFAAAGIVTGLSYGIYQIVTSDNWAAESVKQGILFGAGVTIAEVVAAGLIASVGMAPVAAAVTGALFAGAAAYWIDSEWDSIAAEAKAAFAATGDALQTAKNIADSWANEIAKGFDKVGLEAIDALKSTASWAKGIFSYLEIGLGATTEWLAGIFDEVRLDTSTLSDIFNKWPSNSPIILDLDGNGVTTTSERNGVFFDLDCNGMAEHQGWVDSNDGLLVWDRNGNGRIDNGAELFGNQALKRDGALAKDGFEILQSYDLNADGKINSADALWANLKLWVDANHNGITDAGELKTLASQSVAALNVTPTWVATSYDADYGYLTQHNDGVTGNHPLLQGNYTRTDGTTREMTDVFFNTRPELSVTSSWTTVPAAIAALPDLPGAGNVVSLHQAMARDATGTLQNLVQSFATQTTAAGRKTVLDQIILKWTGAENVNPNSRDSVFAPYNGAYHIDARILTAVEAFLGRQYTRYNTFSFTGSVHDPEPGDIQPILDSYAALSEKLYAQLAAQTFLKPFYDKVTPVWDATGMRFSTSAALADLFNPVTPDATRRANVTEFYRTIFAAGLDSTQLDYTGLIAAAQAQVPQYMADINAVTQSYFLARNLLANEYEGGAVTGGLGNDTIQGGDNNDTLKGNAGNDLISGGWGDDLIYGGEGDDDLSAGVGNDSLYGGNGNDTIDVGYYGVKKIYGESGDDLISVYAGGNGLYAGPWAGTVIDGGVGNNTLYANNGSDISNTAISNVQTLKVFGGTTLTAAKLAGFSNVVADNPYNNPTGGHINLQAANAGTYDLTGKTVSGRVDFTGSGGHDIITGNAAGQYIDGADGDDTLYGMAGDDTLNAGNGNNTLYGGDGNDDLTSGSGVDKLYGGNGDDSFNVAYGYVTAGEIIDGGAGINTLSSYMADISAATISNIQILRSSYAVTTLTASQLAGFSTLIADTGFAGIQAASAGTYGLNGKTVTGRFDIQGSAGNDTLIGDGNVQTLYGYDGNDVLQGLGGADAMYGGNGDDEFLIGGTEVVAGEIIDGEAGNNKISAWGGNLSLATISNVQMLGLNTATITMSAAQFAAFIALANNTGAAATVTGSNAGTYNLSVKTVTGSAINLTGSSGADTLRGNAAAQTLTGGDGNDVLQGLGGADNMQGGNGDDEFLVGGTEVVSGEVINGGAGNNKISAWGGNLSLATISNVKTLALNTNAITVSAAQFGGFTTFQNNAGAVATVTASNAGTYDLSVKTTTGSAISLTGSSGNDILRGNAAAQTLTGNAGNDTLDGKAGADSLIGGTGNDTYIFGLGYGADSVTENDATAGNMDIISVLSGTARDQLWFTKSGNDLQVRIIGTSDIATVKNWYLGSANKVEQIKTAAGNTLLDSKVQNLVNAMAGLAVPSTTTLSAAYHTALDPVIAANWT